MTKTDGLISRKLIEHYKHVNTNKFREAALHFKEFGKYTNEPVNSRAWKLFWEQEQQRIRKGFKAGHDFIPGYFYNYLNYSPILKATIVDGVEYTDDDSQLQGERIEDFPDFWDGDYIYFNYLEEAERSGKHACVLKTRGRGYEQPHSSIIKTPYGDKTMGEIKVGDVVCTPNSYPAEVLEKYPQGVKDVYEVEFSDGRVVKCGLDHLWAVYKNYEPSKKRPYKVLTLKQIIEDGLYYDTSQKQRIYKYRLPEIEPVLYTRKQLPLDPYILGCLLGDGSMSTGSIKIASSDDEIIESFRTILGKDYEIIYDDSTTNNHRIVYKAARKDWDKVNPVKDIIIALGVNVSCKKKFIPELYKTSGIKDRMALIQGLLDTDGCVNKDGSIEFTNSCKQLIDDTADVLRSLGISCKKGIDERGGHSFIGDREVKRGMVYRLYIKTNLPVFRLTRKLARLRPDKHLFTKPFIRDVRLVGQEESSCIFISSDNHIYLTNDFIPTHNSFKGGSMLCRNYYHIPNSRSYAIASEKEFLTKDGILTKAWANMDFLDAYTPFRKRRSVKDTEMHKRASYREDVDGSWVEKGYMSEIMGISLKNDPSKGRGKRGKLLLFEEAGEFPGLLKAWQVARPSVEQGRITYGLMIAFGTGGSKEGDYAGLEELFYKPQAYNILAINNVWDENASEDKCALFQPEYMNYEGYIDKDGNSDIVKAKARIEADRAIIKAETTDPEALLSAIAEKPNTPQEALQKTSGNFFNVVALKSVERNLASSSVAKFLGTHVKFYRNNEGLLISELDPDAVPLNKFPLDKGIDKTGAITIYHAPYRDSNGRVPHNLYYAVADPYGLTSKGGESLGCIYILSFPNNITTHPDDCIVASYIGRPKDQDDWNANAFMLAEYYNARITPENDRGNIIDYARYNKLLHQLEPEFPILSSKGNMINQLGRGYGISMGNRETKLQAIIYYNGWLNKLRSKDAEGRQLMNMHLIPDIALIQESIKYNLDGNFDRVSAMLLASFVRVHKLESIIKQNRIPVTKEFDKLFSKRK